MCLLDPRRTKGLRDVVAYKVVRKSSSPYANLYYTPFACWPLRAQKEWQLAQPEWYGSYVNEYGFHAYVRKADAMRARTTHTESDGAAWRYVVLRVELGDVFQLGWDRSFSTNSKVECYAARAIRVIEEVV